MATMKSYYVYILLCTDGRSYTGITDDFERRLYEHQIGANKSSFTYGRRPLKLIFLKEFKDVRGHLFWEED